MPSTLTHTCALCGLRYTNGALLELHIREDHVQQAVPARDDAAGHPADEAGRPAAQAGTADRPTTQADAGRSPGGAMAPGRPPSIQTPAAGTAPTRPRRRLPGSVLAALRRSARVARQAGQAVRYANQELLRASGAISLRRDPEPRPPQPAPAGDDARPAAEGTEPTRRAA